MENINLKKLELLFKDKKLTYIEKPDKEIVWSEYKKRTNKEHASKGSDNIVIAEYQRSVTVYSNVHFPDKYIDTIRKRDKNEKNPSKRTVNVFKTTLTNYDKFFEIKDTVKPLF